MSEIEIVYIGSKPISKYINAGKWVLNQEKPVRLLGRGNNIKTTVDVAEILKRDIEKPEVFINIKSEDFEDRKVSVLSIDICGKIKSE